MNRLAVARSTSPTQMSWFPETGSMRENANRFPSGERLGAEKSDPVSRIPSCLPLRSRHSNCDFRPLVDP